MKLRAPFPWFGGKSRAAPIIWDALGDVPNYVEPFAGSLAVMLGRPTQQGIETVNDLDCFISNFWRAVATDPEKVAHFADWPVNEADLHPRHQWLVDQVRHHGLAERVMGDHQFFDAEVAGYWVWGLCQWIGGGWCKVPEDGQNIWLPRPNLNQGMGVHKKRGDCVVQKRRPHIHRPKGLSTVSVQLPDISGNDGAAGRGIHASASKVSIIEWMQQLSARLRGVRVCCGDWSRVLTQSPTTSIGLTGIVLDPPYADTAKRTKGLYSKDSLHVAHDVREWAVKNGSNKKMRIVLCGYEGEHEMPKDWRVVEWNSGGGYGGGKNRHRERLWFSPHCLNGMGPLFGR